VTLYLASRFEPVNRTPLTNQQLETAEGALYYHLEELFQKMGAGWSKRFPEGVWAYFEKSDILPSFLRLRQELLERNWEGTGSFDLKVALHAAPLERILGNGLGPALDHTRALLDACPPGQIIMTESARAQLAEPAGYGFQTLGPHLLNDLLEPAPLFALKPSGLPTGEMPPPISLDTFPQNLPAQSVPFLGREEEIEKILLTLGSPGKRLLSLVGPGGFGKTRLSLQAAAQSVDRFPDGVYFIALAPLSSSRYMVETLAQALKFVFTGGEDSEKQLFHYLADKRLLLIMDNFEHVLEGADLVGRILQAAPNVTILVTSRERLKMGMEETMEIKGLSYPPAQAEDDPENYAAVRLFLQHAQRAAPGWEPKEEEKRGVGRLSRTLEGMPLGLELSAAWVRDLTPEEIADKIESNRDFLAAELPYLPTRQQSLRAVFEYSWVLLSEAQKKALRACSVFKGGFTPKAAAHVGGVSPAVFKELSQKFLVRTKPNGYLEVHDLLKFYAKEKLFKDKAEKERILDAHSAYLAQELRKHEKNLWGPKQGATLAILTDEIENIREGWRRAVEQGHPDRLGDYLDCVFSLYEAKGWYQEGLEAFQGAAEAFALKDGKKESSRAHRVLRGKILARWGVLLQRMGELKKAKKVFEESLYLLKKERAFKEQAFPYSGMGLLMETLGRDDQALGNFRRSYLLYRRAGDKAGMAYALNYMGHTTFLLGNFYEGQKYVRQAMAFYESVGSQAGAANSYNLMGDILHDLSDYEQARYYYQKSLSAFVACGDRKGVAWSFNNLGRAIEAVGNYEGALEMYKEGLKLHQEFGDKRALGWSHNLLAAAQWAMGDYVSASQHAKTGLELYSQVGDPRGQTWSLDLLGNLAVSERRFEEARVFYERGRQVQEKEGVKPLDFSWYTFHRGALLFAEGKLTSARRHMESALEQLKRHANIIGTVSASTFLAEIAVDMGRLSQARKYLVYAFDQAVTAKIAPHLVDIMVALAKYTKASGDERNAFAFLALGLHHSSCRRETKDRIMRLAQQLESRLPPQEVRDLIQWSRAARIEDVARDWMANAQRRGPRKAARTGKGKVRPKGKRKK
jgi:predicted ATPase